VVGEVSAAPFVDFDKGDSSHAGSFEPDAEGADAAE
jgi:hypothetical protein